jgi:hypothetical protein
MHGGRHCARGGRCPAHDNFVIQFSPYCVLIACAVTIGA